MCLSSKVNTLSELRFYITYAAQRVMKSRWGMDQFIVFFSINKNTLETFEIS